MAELGWTEPAVRHAARAGDVERLGRGVVAPPLEVTDDLAKRRIEELRLLRAAQASRARCPRTAISHFPAAVALGIPTFGPLKRPCVTVPSATALRRLADAHLHRATLRPEDVVRLAGDDVTAPQRTVMDIAREHGVEAGVVAADYVLHEKIVTRDALAAQYDLCSTWPGRRNARITLLSADGDAESPLESVSRLRLAAAGLPAARLQVEICDVDGRYITRSDFYWDEFGVVGEADGLMKYDAKGRVAKRQDATQIALELTGLTVVGWGWADLFDFSGVVRRLELAFERGVRRGSRSRRWGILRPRS